MKFLTIISVISVTVYGRPEPPHPYEYNSPAESLSSYSAPLASVGLIPNNASTEVSGPTPDVTSSVTNELTNGSKDSVSTSYTEQFHSSAFASNIDHELVDEDESGHKQTVIEKNIYVHLPSQQVEEEQQQRAIQLPLPRIHYKIIFIKAPAPANAAPVVPALPQDEERTIIYVLVKKPEEQQDIVITTTKPTPPSKPEVYFIRYKTQTDKSNATSEEELSTKITKSQSLGVFDNDTDDNAVEFGNDSLTKSDGPY